MNPECAALADALRRGGDGPVSRSGSLTTGLAALTAIAGLLGGVLLYIFLNTPAVTTVWWAIAWGLAGTAVLGGLLLSLVKEGYVLENGRLLERACLFGYQRIRDLGLPSEYAGVAMWVEKDWVWRLAVLTPGGGLLRLEGGGSGDHGKARAQKSGEDLAKALKTPFLVGPGRGPVTGWRLGPSLVQEGSGPVAEGQPVVRDLDTNLEMFLAVTGVILLLLGLLGLYVGYGMYAKDWLVWARPTFALGALFLLARFMLREDLCYDPGTRTVTLRRIFHGLHFPRVWCRFDDLEAVAVRCTRTNGKGGPSYHYHAWLVQRNGNTLQVSNSSDYNWTVAEVQDLARVCDSRAFIPPAMTKLIIQRHPEGGTSLSHTPF